MQHGSRFFIGLGIEIIVKGRIVNNIGQVGIRIFKADVILVETAVGIGAGGIPAEFLMRPEEF